VRLYYSGFRDDLIVSLWIAAARLATLVDTCSSTGRETEACDDDLGSEPEQVEESRHPVHMLSIESLLVSNRHLSLFRAEGVCSRFIGGNSGADKRIDPIALIHALSLPFAAIGNRFAATLSTARICDMAMSQMFTLASGSYSYPNRASSNGKSPLELCAVGCSGG
jgi:hypothetical protein